MKMSNKLHSGIPAQAGFTLVELAIVLVIIGLIISSVLVGQDLVRSAELRASVTQYESFNSAVGTFRGKYNGIPGDVTGATSYGFTGNGNADGDLLTATTTPNLIATSENIYFWNHLGSSGAALISGSYLGNAIVTSTNIATLLPAAKAGNYWGVFAGQTSDTAEVDSSTAESGSNFYILGVTGDVSTTGVYTTTATLTPLEAKNIDDKVDDGKPGSGIVRARGAHISLPDTEPTAAAASTSTTTCVGGNATYVGNASSEAYATQATTAYCTLRFKMPF